MSDPNPSIAYMGEHTLRPNTGAMVFPFKLDASWLFRPVNPMWEFEEWLHDNQRSDGDWFHGLYYHPDNQRIVTIKDASLAILFRMRYCETI